MLHLSIISTTLCNWILDFLTNRPQSVRIGSLSSSTLVLNTGAPQGCVLSPLLFTLYTQDCNSRHGENSIVKFADYTTIIDQISKNHKFPYRKEINHLAEWCTENNLLLNVSKTKELIVDFRKKEAKTHKPVFINEAEVEQVSFFSSWESTLQRTCHGLHISLLWLKKLRNGCIS